METQDSLERALVMIKRSMGFMQMKGDLIDKETFQTLLKRESVFFAEMFTSSCQSGEKFHMIARRLEIL